MGASHRHTAKRTTGWVELGHITTNVGTFAIVAPSMASALDDAWHRFLIEKLPQPTVDAQPKFDEWTLQAKLYNCSGEQHEYTERAVLFDTGPEGGCATVEGRFGPYLGEAGDPDEDDYPSMQLVELRIRLHDWDCNDECGREPRRRRRVRIRRSTNPDQNQ